MQNNVDLEKLEEVESAATMIEEKKEEKIKLGYLAYRAEWFSPAWYNLIMGIGITASIIYKFPFANNRPDSGFKIVGIVLAVFDLICFVVFSAVFFYRCFARGQFCDILRNPKQSVFFGCIPMGFSCLINMVIAIWGSAVWKLSLALWILDLVMSIASCLGMVYTFAVLHNRVELSDVSATVVLPIVSMVVCSSTGALAAANFPEGWHMPMVALCAMVLAIGAILAAAFIVVYISRVVLCGPVPRPMGLTNLLVVGPLGQSSFAIMLMAGVFRTHHSESIFLGDAIVSIATFFALSLCSLGIFWCALTAAFVIRSPPPAFNPSFWALTFPVGTLVMSFYELGIAHSSTAFNVIGTIIGCAVVISAIGCLIESVRYGLIDDKLFKLSESEMKH